MFMVRLPDCLAVSYPLGIRESVLALIGAAILLLDAVRVGQVNGKAKWPCSRLALFLATNNTGPIQFESVFCQFDPLSNGPIWKLVGVAPFGHHHLSWPHYTNRISELAGWLASWLASLGRRPWRDVIRRFDSMRYDKIRSDSIRSYWTRSHRVVSQWV